MGGLFCKLIFFALGSGILKSALSIFFAAYVVKGLLQGFAESLLRFLCSL